MCPGTEAIHLANQLLRLALEISQCHQERVGTDPIVGNSQTKQILNRATIKCNINRINRSII